MCWNIESSVISAVYGYLVSVYLYKRNYSVRDSWYAVFLATFTTTQGNKLLNMIISFCKSIRLLLLQLILPPSIVFDAYFWWLAGEGKYFYIFHSIPVFFFFFFFLAAFPLIRAIMILTFPSLYYLYLFQIKAGIFHATTRTTM